MQTGFRTSIADKSLAICDLKTSMKGQKRVLWQWNLSLVWKIIKVNVYVLIDFKDERSHTTLCNNFIYEFTPFQERLFEDFSRERLDAYSNKTTINFNLKIYFILFLFTLKFSLIQRCRIVCQNLH